VVVGIHRKSESDPSTSVIKQSDGFNELGKKKSKTAMYSVGFEVLTAVRTKMAVFWVVAPCSLVEV
jgi:hypothetical protein